MTRLLVMLSLGLVLGVGGVFAGVALTQHGQQKVDAFWQTTNAPLSVGDAIRLKKNPVQAINAGITADNIEESWDNMGLICGVFSPMAALLIMTLAVRRYIRERDRLLILSRTPLLS